MRFFVLPGLLLGSFLLLTSCSSNHAIEVAPQKTFQYAFKGPARTLADANLARQLTSGKSGALIKIKLANNRLSPARLGQNYYSANGHSCRKYTVQPIYEYTACQIGGRWYMASPILHSKQN